MARRSVPQYTRFSVVRLQVRYQQVFNFTSYEVWEICFPNGTGEYSNYAKWKGQNTPLHSSVVRQRGSGRSIFPPFLFLSYQPLNLTFSAQV